MFDAVLVVVPRRLACQLKHVLNCTFGTAITHCKVARMSLTATERGGVLANVGCQSDVPASRRR